MIIIKKNRIRWIIFGLCLILFITIMVFVIIKNDLYIDKYGYNLISKLKNENMTNIIKIITNIGGTIIIAVVTILSLFIFRKKKIDICIILNLLGIFILNNVLIKNIIARDRPTGINIIE